MGLSNNAVDTWLLHSMSTIVLKDPMKIGFVNVILGDSDTYKRDSTIRRLEKLLKRKTITIQEGDSIKAMINSTDVESLELAIALIEEKEKIKTWDEKLIFWKR